MPHLPGRVSILIAATANGGRKPVSYESILAREHYRTELEMTIGFECNFKEDERDES